MHLETSIWSRQCVVDGQLSIVGRMPEMIKPSPLPDRVWSVEFNPSRKTVDLAGHDVRRYWMEGCIAGLLLVLSATATDRAPETDHTAAIGI